MTLKGQNFRIMTLQNFDGVENYVCIAKATNCSITLTNNTEDASNKDVVGMAQNPVVTTKSWQVSVDSLDVSDMGAMLTAIANFTPFDLLWDETLVVDNQIGEEVNYARKGKAYLSDATFVFNDRNNSTKAIQFTGTSALERLSTTHETYDSYNYVPGYTKGQFVRLFLSATSGIPPQTVIAAAKDLQFHVSVSLETATTKDTDGDWDIQEPVGLSYDISTRALIRASDTITSSVGGLHLDSIESLYANGTPVPFQIANVSGDNQRTKGSAIVSGSVIVQSLVMNGPNRANADYTAQLVGFGAYAVVA